MSQNFVAFSEYMNFDNNEFTHQMFTIFQEIFHICMLENEGVAVIGRNLAKTYHSAMLQYTVKWSVFFVRKIVFDFRSSGIVKGRTHFRIYGKDSISFWINII